MAVTITVANDDNHSITISKTTFARAFELGEVLTVNLPSALNSTYPYAYIHFLQADGHSYFIDNGGTGFTWSSGSFAYAIGSTDTMLEFEGTLAIQIIIRDLAPPDTTKEWRSSVVRVTVDNSVYADTDSYSGIIDSLNYNNLPASRVSLADTAGRYSSTNVENALAEIAGSGRTTETVKSAYDLANTANTNANTHIANASVHITGSERNKLAGIEAGAQVNNISDNDATDLTDGGTTTLHNHDGRYVEDDEYVHTDNNFTNALKTKLDGIETGAEVNNISDTDANDLTDGGTTTLHNHDSRYYTESEVNSLLSGKEDADSTILKEIDIGISVQEFNADTVVDASYVHTDNNFTDAFETKLTGIEAGAEVNQNAFSHFAVSGQTTVDADSKTDTLTLVAGANISITTSAVSDSITISATGDISVSAENTSIVDVGEYFISTNVEGALQEVGYALDNISTTASDITVVDVGEYFASTEVEGALQEVGFALDSLDTAIGAVEQNISDMISGTDAFDTISFNTSAGDSVTTGQFTWNSTEGTLDLGVESGSILQVGQELVYRVYNNSGSVIVDGTAVYAYGIHGDQIDVRPAIADGTIPANKMLGIATSEIAIGGLGYVTHFGKVRDVPGTYANGTILYVSDTVAGGYTNVQPTSPHLNIPLAMVYRQHGMMMDLIVRVQTGSTLGQLHDVYTGTPNDGDALIWDATDSRWESTAIPIPPSALSDLTDTDIDTPTDGQLLTYNDTTDKWENKDAPSGGQYIGTATTKAISYNAQTIAENITIPATANAMSVGPITIADGFTVTTETGSRWVIL